jgi:hypothetical protein
MKDFTKCNVLIYDYEQNLITNAKIWEHNQIENYIVIQDWPELAGLEECKLLVLTSPTPFSYVGMPRKRGTEWFIKLFEEQVEENRREIRYRTDLPGSIECLIYGGKVHPLHTVLEVRVVNISKSGIRILAKENTLSAGVGFHIQLKIGENNKTLAGTVVNLRNTPQSLSEYGCRLMEKDGD